MSPALALTAIVTLAVLLAIVSAIAGALWWRVRSLPLIEAVRLARALMARRRALEVLLERVATLEAAAPAPAPVANAPRVDPGKAESAGPKLIAVPDLAAPPGLVPGDLGERHAAVLDLADAGASADEIARATQQPIGQVELVLGLRRRLAQQGPAGGRP